MAEIVVGVDGSDSSVRAARWAIEEASLRSTAVRIVCAFQAPAAWLGMGEALGATMTTGLSEDDLRSYSNSTINSVLDQIERPEGLEVIADPQMGHASDVLIAASKQAELLVVGSRGHGDIGSVLLGSTGMHCVHHAACPVVVVPHDAG
jgi:nucleotide-binding universal stress UspA family protein